MASLRNFTSTFGRLLNRTCWVCSDVYIAEIRTYSVLILVRLFCYLKLKRQKGYNNIVQYASLIDRKSVV